MRRIKKGDIVRMRMDHLGAVASSDLTSFYNLSGLGNPLRMYKVSNVGSGKYYCNVDCPSYSVCKSRLENHHNPYDGGRDRIELSNGFVYCEADVIKVTKKTRFIYEMFGPDGLTISEEKK